MVAHDAAGTGDVTCEGCGEKILRTLTRGSRDARYLDLDVGAEKERADATVLVSVNPDIRDERVYSKPLSDEEVDRARERRWPLYRPHVCQPKES